MEDISNQETTPKPLDAMLVEALLKDRKADRRWKIIRFFIFLGIILFFIFGIIGSLHGSKQGATANAPYVALVRMSGEIMPDSDFSADNMIRQLIPAFQDTKAKGVVLLMNSPGGSAVQASIIHDKIVELKKQYHKTVVLVGEDAVASGGYLIATAADKIYVNRDTLTGSIGVIMSGFGFSDALQKIGVSRRVYTAGDHKDRLDPFEPVAPDDIAKVKRVLNTVHQSFIQDVIDGRGSRLNGKPEELFSGDFWTGTEAVKLGLADGTDNLWTVLQKEFNVKHYRDYSGKPPFLQALLKGIHTELHSDALREKMSFKLEGSQL